MGDKSGAEDASNYAKNVRKDTDFAPMSFLLQLYQKKSPSIFTSVALVTCRTGGGAVYPNNR
jgi:hypothetical protein